MTERLKAIRSGGLCRDGGMVFISEGQNAVRSMIISIPQSESERVRVGEGWGGGQEKRKWKEVIEPAWIIQYTLF